MFFLKAENLFVHWKKGKKAALSRMFMLLDMKAA